MKRSAYSTPVEEAVARFEADTSFSLPKSYKDFLSSSEEFPREVKPVPVTETVPKELEYYIDEGTASVGHFLGTRIKDGEYVLDALYLAREWDIPKGLVLIAGDGHTWFALDYRSCSKEPPVVFLAGEEWHSVHVASTFAEFFSMCLVGPPNK